MDLLEKNEFDSNYIYLAEHLGELRIIIPNIKAIDIGGITRLTRIRSKSNLDFMKREYRNMRKCSPLQFILLDLHKVPNLHKKEIYKGCY